MKRYLKTRLKDQRGVTVVIVALMAVTLLSFTALAIDIGYTLVTRNELQNVADASALAAARQLGQNYVDNGMSDSSVDPGGLIGVAEAVALKNQAAGKYIVVDGTDGISGDVIIGKWDFTAKTLAPGLSGPLPNAVRVIARRDANANGPITTFFARIFGKDTISVTTKATAALSSVPIGKPSIPIGISEHYFEEGCVQDKKITFYPTCTKDPCEDSCGGWHTYTDSPSDAEKLKNKDGIIDQLIGTTYPIPETIAGETRYNFIGGTLASVVPKFKELFDTMKGKNDGILDLDTPEEDPGGVTWKTMVAVYDSAECKNPSGLTKIVGFAVVTIKKVTTSPDNEVSGHIDCNVITPESRGGGGTSFGALSPIPSLVE